MIFFIGVDDQAYLCHTFSVAVAAFYSVSQKKISVSQFLHLLERYWLLTHDILARFMRHFRFRGRVLCITGYSSWDSPSTAPFFFFLFLLCPLIMLRFHGFESEIPMCIFGYSLLPLKVRATIHKVHNNKKRLNPHLSLYEAAIFIV